MANNPSMYDLALSSNRHSRTQTVLAGATLGTLIAGQAGQRRDAQAQITALNDLNATCERGFADVTRNQREMLENQLEIIENQKVQTEIMESMSSELRSINLTLRESNRKLEAIKNLEWAQYRQTPQGQIHVHWEHLALEYLEIIRFNDALMRKAVKGFWDGVVLPARPEVRKKVPLPTPDSKPSLMYLAAIPFLVALCAFSVWVLILLRDWDWDPGWLLVLPKLLISLLGLLVFGVLGIGSALISVVLLFKPLGHRSALKRYEANLAKYELRKSEAIASNAEREKEAKALWEWRNHRNSITEEIGCERDDSIDWMTPADRRHVERVVKMLAEGRVQVPDPVSLPALYIPLAVGDAKTKIGRFAMSLNEPLRLAVENRGAQGS